jgi:flagellar biosynthesis component FlhA
VSTKKAVSQRQPFLFENIKNSCLCETTAVLKVGLKDILINNVIVRKTFKIIDGIAQSSSITRNFDIIVTEKKP